VDEQFFNVVVHAQY